MYYEKPSKIDSVGNTRTRNTNFHAPDPDIFGQ